MLMFQSIAPPNLGGSPTLVTRQASLTSTWLFPVYMGNSQKLCAYLCSQSWGREASMDSEPVLIHHYSKALRCYLIKHGVGLSYVCSSTEWRRQLCETQVSQDMGNLSRKMHLIERHIWLTSGIQFSSSRLFLCFCSFSPKPPKLPPSLTVCLA